MLMCIYFHLSIIFFHFNSNVVFQRFFLYKIAKNMKSTCNIKRTSLFSCYMPSGGEKYRNGNITYTRHYSSKLKNSITNSQIKFT